ncbi:hypothetical protein PS687_05971 [Pseudomonas fluorescens]|nr:hypothetical protein PS687_05971 [Pseudomonas fluorescens]
MPFFTPKHVQFTQALLRVTDDGLQQVLPMPGQTLDGWGFKQIDGIGEGGQQIVGGLGGVQREVELGAGQRAFQDFKAQAGQADAVLGLHAGMVVHHLEQRAMAEAALRLQGFHQLLEGQVLVSLGLQGMVFDLLQHVDKPRLAVEFRAQYLGVDEKADQSFGFHAVAVGNRHTDTDVGLPAVAMQQGLERGQQQHEQRHALLLGQLLERLIQLVAQRQFQLGAAVALLGRPGVVGGQFQYRLLATQLFGPVGQLALALSGFHPLALPHAIVGVLHRQVGEADGLLLAETGVKGNQLLDHHVDRPAIGDNMVLGEDQDVIVIRQFQQFDPEQRAVLQVEQLLDFVFNTRLDHLLVCARP